MRPSLHFFRGLLLIMACGGTTLAATLDPSFAPLLRDFGSSAEGFSSAQISVVQPDGKILIGGRFTVANGVARSGIARFHPDYTLDLSFNAGDFSVPRPAFSRAPGASFRPSKSSRTARSSSEEVTGEGMTTPFEQLSV